MVPLLWGARELLFYNTTSLGLCKYNATYTIRIGVALDNFQKHFAEFTAVCLGRPSNVKLFRLFGRELFR